MSGAFTAAALVCVSVLVWPRRRRPAGWQPARPAPPGGRQRMVTSQVPSAVLLELVSAALGAGLATSAAIEAVRDAVEAVGGRRPDLRGPRMVSLTRALHLADRTGASPVVMLRRAADDDRARVRRDRAVAAGRLGVRLVLPLGLAVLPSFVLLGVAPVVLGLATQYLGSW